MEAVLAGLTTTQMEKAVSMCREGATSKQIGRALKLPSWAVMDALKSVPGLRMRYRRSMPSRRTEKEAVVREMNAAGELDINIAKRLGCTREYVRLLRAGLGLAKNKKPLKPVEMHPCVICGEPTPLRLQCCRGSACASRVQSVAQRGADTHTLDMAREVMLLRGMGKTILEIAEAVGISHAYVQKLIRRYYPDAPAAPEWSSKIRQETIKKRKEKDRKIRALLVEGKTCREVAEILGVSYSTVRDVSVAPLDALLDVPGEADGDASEHPGSAPVEQQAGQG